MELSQDFCHQYIIDSGPLSLILIMIFGAYIACYSLVENRSDLVKLIYHIIFIGGFYGLAIMQVLIRLSISYEFP